MASNLVILSIGMLGVLGVLIIGLIIFGVIVKWKTFEKAGKPGWAAIVPIYNSIILLEIVGYKWYYVFFYLLAGTGVGAIVSSLFDLTYNIKLAKSFNKDAAFGIGLWLLSPIFLGIVAFNKEINYVGPCVNGDIDFDDLF